MTISNVLFCTQLNDIQFTVKEEWRWRKILTSKKWDWNYIDVFPLQKLPETIHLIIFSYTYLKVPYYTGFHQFHTTVRDPTTLFPKCIAPNRSVVLNFSCLKVAQVSSTELYWQQVVSVPAPLNVALSVDACLACYTPLSGRRCRLC